MEKYKNVATEKDEVWLNRLITNVDHFKKEHWFSVTSNEKLLDGRQAKIFYSGGVFHFEIAIVESVDPEQVDKIMRNMQIWIEFSNERKKFYAGYSSFLTFNADYLFAHGYITFKGKFKRLISLGQTLIPQKFVAILESKNDNYVGAFFTAKNLKVGVRTFGARIIELNIKGNQIQLYLYGRENIDENYLIIESDNEIDYKSFLETVYDAILCITFFTGVFPGKEVFISNTPSEKLNREMMSNVIYPENIKTTHFSPIPKISDQIEGHNKLHVRDGLSSLSSMIEMCISSASFRRTILLMLSANSQPDYTQVVLYSVALESMAKLIYEQNENAMNVIGNKVVEKEIRVALKTSLKEFQNLIEEPAYKKLNARIDNINSPSNQDMLTRPFSLYNIPLTSNDLEAINNRNDFLHGKLTYEAGSRNLSITSLRLHYCVNTLILKYIGYNGAVLYQPWFYQRHHKMLIDCNPFQII